MDNPKVNDQQTSPRGRWSLLIKLAIGFSILGGILYFVDLQEFADAVMGMNLWFVLAIFVLIYVDRALMAYKWDPLLRVVGVQVPFGHLYRTYMIAPMTGIFLPSTIGGDIFRTYSLARYRADVRSALASIVAERLIGFVAMLVLVSVALAFGLYLLRDAWSNFAGVAVLLVIGIGLAATLIVVSLGVGRRYVESMAYRLKGFPLVSKLFDIYNLYTDYRNHKRVLVKVSVWTMVEQMAPTICIFMMAMALNLDVSIIELIAIVPIISLTDRFPIPLEGLGVTEGIFIIMLGLVGVSPAEALVMGSFSRALKYLPGLPWAIHYVLKGHGKTIPQQVAQGAGRLETE